MGDSGCHSDGGIFLNSSFGKALGTGTLAIPNPQSLPSTTQSTVPFVFVGGETSLKPNFLRPYSGKNLHESLAIFNY